MKKLADCIYGGFVIIMFYSLQSCYLEPVLPNDQKSIIKVDSVEYVAALDSIFLYSLVGDKDGIGIGLVDGDYWSPATSGLNTWPIDYRDNDPEFTDVYPSGYNGVIEYRHEFNAIGEEILSAKFVFTTLSIQDGDSQVQGSDTDILFFIDGEEIEGAFDDVDQFSFYDGKWMGSVGTFELAIPQHLLPKLQDGVVVVRWEILQLGTISSIDAIAIDYSELVIIY